MAYQWIGHHYTTESPPLPHLSSASPKVFIVIETFQLLVVGMIVSPASLGYRKLLALKSSIGNISTKQKGRVQYPGQ